MADNLIKLPADFSIRMQQQLGNYFPDFSQALQKTSPISIRVNPLKSKAKYQNSVPWSSYGFYLDERPVFTLDPSFHAGAYYVQEASSMFLEQVVLQLNLDKNPIKVLDLCAAPGGKSTHLLSLLHPESLLVSNEVIRTRASILNENLTKWGYPNVVITNNDARDFQKLTGFFDVIVLDAPCSGEGLFRKDPEAMKEWSVNHVELCARRQQRILEDIWPALKFNGIIIYSTCTYNELENEDNLTWLGKNHSWNSLSLELNQAWGVEEVKFDNRFGYRFYSHLLQGEGFFISLIQKRENEHETLVKIKRDHGQQKSKIPDELFKWIRQPDQFNFDLKNQKVTLQTKSLTDISHYFQQHFRVIQAGTPLAELKGNKLVPDHALALSVHLNGNHFTQIELNKEEALNFLRKEALSIPYHNRGFGLVTYDSIPLGWVNILDHRINNLYPKEWRIRNL